MSTPRVIGIVFCSLFLVLGLFVFSWLLTTKMTALNAGYVTARLESLPIADIVNETDFGEDFEDNPQLAELIKTTVADNEEEFKLRSGELIDSVYEYLHGRSQQLDLALVLKETLVDPSFAISIINNADLTPLSEELIRHMIAEVELPYGLSLEAYIEELARDTERWLKQQIASVIPPLFDYMLGFSQQADITIPVEDLRQEIKEILKQDFLDNTPPEFDALTKAELEQKFDEIFDNFAADIPIEFEISTEGLQSDEEIDFAQSLHDVEEALTESRRFIGIFNLVFGLLIGFIILLIAAIILLHRQLKGASLTLGIVLFTFGLINIIIASVTRGIANSQMTRSIQESDVHFPTSFQQWLSDFIASSTTPVLILAIVLFVIGALLLAFYFLYPRYRDRQAETSF